jgi:hypothetical protein
MVTDDTEYMSALRRAVGLVDTAFGSPGASTAHLRRNDQVAHDAEVALVELMAVETRHNERRPGAYLPQPAHLPDDEHEMRALFNSAAAKDKSLRADLIEWAALNKRVARDAVFSLRVPVLAYHKATALMSTTVDEEHEKIAAWRHEIDVYLRLMFRVDVRKAPTDPAEIEAWCMEAMMKNNPCPEWLYNDDSAPSKIFAPKPVASARDIIKLVRDEPGDDDGE